MPAASFSVKVCVKVRALPAFTMAESATMPLCFHTTTWLAVVVAANVTVPAPQMLAGATVALESGVT